MSMELIDKKKLIEKVKTFHKWCIHTDNFPTIPSKRNNVGYLADDVLFGIELEPTVKAIPIEVVEQIKEEISKCKTEHEMQISERDTKGMLMISDIFCDVIGIIDKELKEQNEW